MSRHPLQRGTRAHTIAEALEPHRKPLDVHDLMRATGIDRAGLVDTLRYLMALELVMRGTTPRDRTGYTLTSIGRGVLLAMGEAHCTNGREPRPHKPSGPTVVQPSGADLSLLTRGRVRAPAGAELGPRPLRPGALDAAACPRIECGWRIWPDGRRERIEQRKESQQ